MYNIKILEANIKLTTATFIVKYLYCHQTINILKTDSIFYQIFLNFPTIFFELINQPNTNTQTYEFTSREVKQLSFRLDGLFLPTDNNPNKPFYLVEV